MIILFLNSAISAKEQSTDVFPYRLVDPVWVKKNDFKMDLASSSFDKSVREHFTSEDASASYQAQKPCDTW